MSASPDEPAAALAVAPASGVTSDPWSDLTRLTPARLALGRAGASLPTREVLALGLAHARARDAVHASFDVAALAAGIGALGRETLEVESAAPDRAVYLRRPDFGRRLSTRSRTLLAETGPGGQDLVIMVADGLSATAVDLNALPLLEALLPLLGARSLAPIVLARQGRVALGDEAAAQLGARMVLVLIGERPGLSAADSLGAYLTFGPRIGRSDAERNCVSNIRAGGLRPAAAAGKIAWLIDRAFVLSLTGVGLKDGSDGDLIVAPSPTGVIAG